MEVLGALRASFRRRRSRKRRSADQAGSEQQLSRPISSETSDCAVCHGYRANPQLPRGWNPQWTALAEATKAGCPICSVMHSAISAIAASEPVSWIYVMVGDSKGLLIYVDLAAGESRFLELCFDGGVPSAFPAIVAAKRISASGNSEDAFKVARSWLQDCVSNHSKCAGTPKAPLPTRLVDVGSDTADPYLHIPVPGEDAEYVALSHCWGTEKLPLQTTVANLPAMRRAIPFHDLPRNFQDALIVTRAFNIRYIWIDSLCIVQDSSNDWHTQSARMGPVYSQALFVLAAAAGQNCYSGFLNGGNRDPGVAIDSRNESIDNSFFVRRYPWVFDTYGGHCRFTKERTALSTRGWAFQEEMLARRLLAYSDEEMSWMCLETAFCECKSTPNTLNSVDSKRFINSTIKDNTTFSSIWIALVQEFSRRELSFPSDRLPAFSGIAERVQSPTTGQYLAGIWSSYLFHGLAWAAGSKTPNRRYLRRKQNTESRRQPDGYAPSWSWASITGLVTFWSLTARYEPDWDISTKEVLFEPDQLNPYGTPKAASLKVTGRLREVELSAYLEDQWFLNGEDLIAMADVWHDGYNPMNQPYYFLPFFHYEEDKLPETVSMKPRGYGVGLILQRISEADTSYERVACVQLDKGKYADYKEACKETAFTFV